MMGIMSSIIPPGPIKNAPRAIKSDCADPENSFKHFIRPMHQKKPRRCFHFIQEGYRRVGF